MKPTISSLQEYARLPQMRLVHAVSLGKALLAQWPAGAQPHLDRQKVRLEQLVAQGGDELAQQSIAVAKSDGHTRLLDLRADAQWTALRDRIAAYAMLPEERYPGAKTARELGALLFSDNLAFLRESFEVQAERMSALLAAIDQRGLGSAIDQLAGPEFLAELRALQPEYVAMVQANLSRAPGPAKEARTILLALRDVMTQYVSSLIAQVDPDDSASWAHAEQSLRPIMSLRAALGRRRARTAAEPEETFELDAAPDEGGELDAL